MADSPTEDPRVALVAQARTLREEGQFDEVLRLLLPELDEGSSDNTPPNPTVGRMHFEVSLALRELGRVEEARAHIERSRQHSTLEAGSTPIELAEVQLQWGVLLGDHGDLAQSREVISAAVDQFREHNAAARQLAGALSALAGSESALGNDAIAVDLQREALAVYLDGRDTHDLPSLALRRSLGQYLRRAGNPQDAIRELEAVVADYTQREDVRPDQIGGAWLSLGTAQYEAGERTAAEASWRAGTEALPETVEGPGQDARIVRMHLRRNLAMIAEARGDATGAISTQDAVLAEARQVWPDGGAQFLDVLDGAALTRARLGDTAGARLLLLELDAGLKKLLPEGHLDRARTTMHLAMVERFLGGREEAAQLLQQLLDTVSESDPAARSLRRDAFENLGVIWGELERPQEQVELMERLLAEMALDDPLDWTGWIHARLNFVTALNSAGQLERALNEGDLLHADMVGADGSSTHLLLNLRGILLRAALGLGREDEALRWSQLCVDLGRKQIDAAKLDSPRGAIERALHMANTAYAILGVAELAAEESNRRAALRLVFQLVESSRAVGALDELRGVAARTKEFAQVAERLRAAQSELARQYLFSVDSEANKFAQRVSERDLSAAELLRSLPPKTLGVGSVTAEALAAALGEGEVAVGYACFNPLHFDAERGRLRGVDTWLYAMLVSASGEVRAVRLARKEDAVHAVALWRDAVGRSVRTIRRKDRVPEAEAGQKLREMILDPVLLAAEADLGRAPTRMFVALDDVLHMVPLDGLPAKAPGERVGSFLDIRVERSFQRLLALENNEVGPLGAGIAVVGDLDYGEAASAGGGSDDPEQVVPRPALRSRSAMLGRWPALPGTRDELEAVLSSAAAAGITPVHRLTGRDVDRARLGSAVAGARVVHLATHGWWQVPTSFDPNTQKRVELLKQSVPHVLTGLALSGANQASPQGASVTGLLTGEEISALDLSSCELVVVSACDGAAGIWSPGMGCFSLQNALHAAGARAVLAALWEVGDEDTAALMARFYEGWLVEGLPVAAALWRAKSALHDEGRPPSAWAGWVLSGGPR